MNSWDLTSEPDLFRANEFLTSKAFYFATKKTPSIKTKRVLFSLRDQSNYQIKKTRKVFLIHRVPDKWAYNRFRSEFGQGPDQIIIARFFAPRAQ